MTNDVKITNLPYSTPSVHFEVIAPNGRQIARAIVMIPTSRRKQPSASLYLYDKAHKIHLENITTEQVRVYLTTLPVNRIERTRFKDGIVELLALDRPTGRRGPWINFNPSEQTAWFHQLGNPDGVRLQGVTESQCLAYLGSYPL